MVRDSKKFKARLVVTSKVTGKDLTFEMKGFKGRSGYTVMVGYESSYMEFQYCALWNPDRAQVYPFNKYKTSDSTIIKGAMYVLKQICSGNLQNLMEQTSITHTGRCLQCNRELTDAESIRIGFGPICRSNV